ncbi:MAG: Rrf2 family transcriptional regulator [Anaerolineae bacterium]
MEITQQADYAVRAVLELALRPEGERVPSDEIADAQDISPSFLIKILARLSAQGICSTQRGVNGGVRLSRAASAICLLDVIEAIDGPITLNRCARHPSDCVRDHVCAVHPIWTELCADLRTKLASYTFDYIAQRARTASLPGQMITLYEELPIQKKT